MDSEKKNFNIVRIDGIADTSECNRRISVYDQNIILFVVLFFSNSIALNMYIRNFIRD